MSGLFVPPGALTPGIVDWNEAQDVSDRLVHGDPTLGWSGDNRMRLVRNFVLSRWEIWRLGDDGIDRCEMSRASDRLDGPALIRRLVEHDTRYHDVVAEVDAANEKVRTDIEAAASERHQETGDKLAHALAKDLGLPAPDGKVYPVR